MSKVESNDEIRIREMQEAQRRTEIRNREADQVKRSEKSFQETLKAHQSRERGLVEGASEDRRLQDQRAARGVLDQVRQSQAKDPQEQARHAAWARALHGKGALTRRAKDSQGDAVALEQRRDGHEATHAVQNDQVDELQRDEDLHDVDTQSTQMEDARREAEATELAYHVSRQRRDSDHREGREGQPDETPAAPIEGAGPSQELKRSARELPPEVLKRIVGTITKLAGDGRTRIKVRLKGRGLEGVELEVRAENGQVSCAFSGCNDRLRKDLKASESALGQALGTRGLSLHALDVQ